MKEFDSEWFESVGLAALPEHVKALFRDHVMIELEQRVGRHLVQRLTREEFDKLEALLGQDNDLETARWLQLHVPERTTVVKGALEQISVEIRQRAAEILAAG